MLIYCCQIFKFRQGAIILSPQQQIFVIKCQVYFIRHKKFKTTSFKIGFSLVLF
jgi:hypothetical protein